MLTKEQATEKLIQDVGFERANILLISRKRGGPIITMYQKGFRLDLFSTILSRRVEGHNHIGNLKFTRIQHA